MVIDNDKIKLRKIKKSDTPNVLKWRNSDAVMNNFIYRKKLTEEIHNKWLETKVEKGEVVQFIAVDELNGVDFGSTYLRDIDLTHHKAEIGIFIGEENYRSKGLGKLLLSKTIDYGFNELNLNKIYARVLSYNIASAKSFEKLGFNKDATLREDVYIDEKYHDVYFYSILKSEWNN